MHHRVHRHPENQTQLDLETDGRLRERAFRWKTALSKGVRKPVHILSGGSLGSWIDEGRSQLRYLMRIADTLSIDTLNAHCGIEIPVPMLRLSEGCI